MADPKRFEIWLARISIGFSQDLRPCVVIESYPDSSSLVFPLSSAKALQSSHFDFAIGLSHPDFKATGLKRDSFVLSNQPRRIKEDSFVKKWGELQGGLLRDFEDWLG